MLDAGALEDWLSLEKDFKLSGDSNTDHIPINRRQMIIASGLQGKFQGHKAEDKCM